MRFFHRFTLGDCSMTSLRRIEVLGEHFGTKEMEDLIHEVKKNDVLKRPVVLVGGKMLKRVGNWGTLPHTMGGKVYLPT